MDNPEEKQDVESYANWRAPAPRRERKTVIESAPDRAEVPITEETLDWIKKFSAFSTQQSDRIRTRQSRGETLKNVIYDVFMTSGSEHFQENDPSFKKLQQEFQEGMGRVFQHWGKLAIEHEDDPNPPIKMNRKLTEHVKGKPVETWKLPDDWIYFKLHGGPNIKERMGRIQLNIRPADIPRIFDEAIRALGSAKIHADIKTTNGDSPVEFERLEKITIYVGASQAQESFDAIRDLYSKNEASFIDEQAPFSKSLQDSQRKPAKGLWFVEEPAYTETRQAPDGSAKEEHFSANEVRAKLLADLMTEHMERDYSPTEYVAAFVRLNKKYRINPRDPAFNL